MSKYIAIPHGKFANWLDQKLMDHDMSRHQLADILGISQATVLNYYGMKTKPRYYIIRDLCDLFDSDCDEIVSLVDSDWSH